MENVYDFGRVAYVPADLIKESTVSEKCVFILDVSIDIVKTIVLGIPHLFISLYHLFVSPAKKLVTGQTVLVIMFNCIDKNCDLKLLNLIIR